MKYSILYLISKFQIGDGATAGLLSQIECDKGVIEDYLIVAQYVKSKSDTYNLADLSELTRIYQFLNRERLLVHYYKASNSCVFYNIVRKLNSTIPVVTTICQSPSYRNLLLTPFEIRHSWHIVFIDQSSYNNPIVNFIPEEKKTQIYLTRANTGDLIPFEKESDGSIVFGRGSTLSKCPKDMFLVFDRINVTNKKFVIVGIPEGDNWVRLEAKKRENVEVLPQLEREEWERLCSKFDIFLYHIPRDSHASLDSTLGTAMMLEIPVVYMGSDAPKERFVHGKNGFVADTIDEAASYATLLANDNRLRRKIGQYARYTTLNEIPGPFSLRIMKYKSVYNNLKENISVCIPVKYSVLCFYKCFKLYFQIFLNRFGLFPNYKLK